MADELGALDSAILSRRIAAGDEEAFVVFYRRWFDPVLAFARAASRRDEAFCLDVVQDVLMIVAKKMPALRDDAAVGAWMTRTLVRAVADRARRDARRQRRELMVGEAARDAVPEPWHAVADAERRSWLEKTLASLSTADRTLLEARFGASTTVVAAGAAVGLGADAAHGRLRRVLERLRREAAEWWHG